MRIWMYLNRPVTSLGRTGGVCFFLGCRKPHQSSNISRSFFATKISKATPLRSKITDKILILSKLQPLNPSLTLKRGYFSILATLHIQLVSRWAR